MLLQRLLLTMMSYYDPAGRQPEKLYHGFISGLRVRIDKDYEVRSNRESGLGRADVLIRPKTPGRPGAVLELKVVGRGQWRIAGLEFVEWRRPGPPRVFERHHPFENRFRPRCGDFNGKAVWVKTAADALT